MLLAAALSFSTIVSVFFLEQIPRRHTLDEPVGRSAARVKKGTGDEAARPTTYVIPLFMYFDATYTNRGVEEFTSAVANRIHDA